MQLHRLGHTVVTERTERAEPALPPVASSLIILMGHGTHRQEAQEITEGKNIVNVLYCYLDPPPSSDAHLPACAALNPDCPGPASQLLQMRTSQRTITGDSQEYTVDAR